MIEYFDVEVPVRFRCSTRYNPGIDMQYIICKSIDVNTSAPNRRMTHTAARLAIRKKIDELLGSNQTVIITPSNHLP